MSVILILYINCYLQKNVNTKKDVSYENYIASKILLSQDVINTHKHIEMSTFIKHLLKIDSNTSDKQVTLNNNDVPTNNLLCNFFENIGITYENNKVNLIKLVF